MTFSKRLICNGIHVWIDLQQVTIKPKESSFLFFHNPALMPIYIYIYVYKPRPTNFHSWKARNVHIPGVGFRALGSGSWGSGLEVRGGGVL